MVLAPPRAAATGKTGAANEYLGTGDNGHFFFKGKHRVSPLAKKTAPAEGYIYKRSYL